MLLALSTAGKAGDVGRAKKLSTKPACSPTYVFSKIELEVYATN